MAGMPHGGRESTKPPAAPPSRHQGKEKAPTEDHAGDGEQEMPGIDHSKMQH